MVSCVCAVSARCYNYNYYHHQWHDIGALLEHHRIIFYTHNIQHKLCTKIIEGFRWKLYNNNVGSYKKAGKMFLA